MRKNKAHRLFIKLPFLKTIIQEDDTGERPVYIVPGENVPAVLDLEYGRYNNNVDTSFTNGITNVYCISIHGIVTEHAIDEGRTEIPSTWLDEAEFFVTRHVYKSMLVYNEPGCITYALYRLESIKSFCAAAAKDEESAAIDFLGRL